MPMDVMKMMVKMLSPWAPNQAGISASSTSPAAAHSQGAGWLDSATSPA